MRSPNPSAPTRKSDNAASSSSHDPRIGRSNRIIDTTMTPTADRSEMAKYGTTLPTTKLVAPSGAIRTCSMVPRSFSRTIESAVEITALIIAM